MNEKDSFQIHTKDVLDAMNKIMKFSEENKIHPLVLMSTSSLLVEFLGNLYNIPRKEIDNMRRESHKIARELQRQTKEETTNK